MDPWLRGLARRFEGLTGREPPDRATLERWLAHAGTPVRLVDSERAVDGFEAAIVRGELPTRAHSWHDAFNTLVFACFPTAKRSLHARVRALQLVRGGDRARRSREEDALTLLDEAVLVVAGTEDALGRLEAARADGELAAVDRVIREQGVAVHVFGHALLEHRVLSRPPIGAGVLPLCIDRVEEAADHGAVDRALTRVIERGALAAPCFAPTVPWPHPIVDAWAR